MRKLILALLVVIGATGCANIERKKADDQIAQITESCLTLVENSPETAILVGKIIIRDNKPATLGMLNNPARASSFEKASIIELDKIAVDCMNRIAETASPHYPTDVMAIIHESAIYGQRARLGLYKGEITFGEYNQAIQDNQIMVKRKLADADRNMRQRQAHQSQQAMNAMSTLYMLNQMNQQARPQQTNTSCVRNGQMVNCTSY